MQTKSGRRIEMRKGSRKPETTARINKIVYLHKEGLSVREIAERIGRSKWTVTYWLHYMNVDTACRAGNRKVTEKMAKKIVIDYVYKNVTQEEIGRQLGVSRRTVYNYLMQAGIEPHYKKKLKEKGK